MNIIRVQIVDRGNFTQSAANLNVKCINDTVTDV